MSRHSLYPPATPTHRVHPVLRALRAAALGIVILYCLCYAAVWLDNVLGHIAAGSTACVVRTAR